MIVMDVAAATTPSSRRSSSPSEHCCNMCGRTFSSVEELSSHKRMKHGQSSKPPAGIS
jgi:hypothetical protein